MGKGIVRNQTYPPVVAVVGAYHPGCRLVCCPLLPACCGVLGISVPLAKTGVSGNEQEVCIPVVAPLVFDCDG